MITTRIFFICYYAIWFCITFCLAKTASSLTQYLFLSAIFLAIGGYFAGRLLTKIKNKFDKKIKAVLHQGADFFNE